MSTFDSIPSSTLHDIPHVATMPELVPQVTLTKTLTNNDTSAPPPNAAPPTALSTGKTGDGVGNDGVDSLPFAPI